MVINNYKGGQLANRVIAFAHLIANSIEYKYELCNPEFDEYCSYFEAPSQDKFDNNPISTTLYHSHFADRAFSRIFRLWADITHLIFTSTPWYKLWRIFKSHDKKQLLFDMNDAAFVKDAVTKTVIIEGWLFRDQASVHKHQDAIRKYFTPVEKYRLEVAAIMQQARQDAAVVIGVHIRRGDYIRFAGGKWYYSDEVYAEKMLSLQQKFNQEGKKCIFLICSNEPVNETNYPTALQLITGNRHFITDLYCLAACDAIIGAPSTFSLWASFYGKVPYVHIQNAQDAIELSAYNQLC